MPGSDLIGMLACSQDRCFVYMLVRCGYATLHHVVDKSKEDRMESFFLSETCKYLYLVSCLLLYVLTLSFPILTSCISSFQPYLYLRNYKLLSLSSCFVHTELCFTNFYSSLMKTTRCTSLRVSTSSLQKAMQCRQISASGRKVGKTNFHVKSLTMSPQPT